MGSTGESIAIDVAPDRAFDLWTDVNRWPTFVDGFGGAGRVDGEWPGLGSKVVWNSKPHGRGRVTEKVVRSDAPHRLETEIFEQRLNGVQSAGFELDDGGRTVFELALDYRLTGAGMLAALTDFLFIRRAIRDSLGRT